MKVADDPPEGSFKHDHEDPPLHSLADLARDLAPVTVYVDRGCDDNQKVLFGDLVDESSATKFTAPLPRPPARARDILALTSSLAGELGDLGSGQRAALAGARRRWQAGSRPAT